MDERQRAYLSILQWGLIAIRESACQGKSRLCEIEANHLHNIPRLLEGAEESQHRHYMEQERGYFLDRLQEAGDEEYLESFAMSRFKEAWLTLAALLEDPS